MHGGVEKGVQVLSAGQRLAGPGGAGLPAMAGCAYSETRANFPVLPSGSITILDT